MADKVDVFIPIYIGDYLGDTQDLNAEEHGAYLLILFSMWKTRAPIQFEKLAWVGKVDPARWPLVWASIGRFFDVSAGMVTQGRLMRELEASLEKKRRATDRGRKGGLARSQAQAEHKQELSTACDEDGAKPARLTLTLTDLPSEVQSRTGEDPDPSWQSVSVLPARSESRAKSVRDLTPNWERYKMPFDVTKDFAAVFARYPNQVGQSKAASAWCAIVEAGFPGGEPALKDAIAARFDSGQLLRHPYAGTASYRPAFDTYLREFRWLDADSAPDDIAPAKIAETLQQRDERLKREAGERRNATKAEQDRLAAEAEAAARARLTASGGAA